jgi:hypothetical protein
MANSRKIGKIQKRKKRAITQYSLVTRQNIFLQLRRNGKENTLYPELITWYATPHRLEVSQYQSRKQIQKAMSRLNTRQSLLFRRRMVLSNVFIPANRPIPGSKAIINVITRHVT